MAEQRQQSSPPSTRRPAGQRGAAQPPTPPAWRVTPAPDGRGQQPQQRPPRGPNTRWLLLILAVGLLALNLWISSQALQPQGRVQVPYYPTFINQVNAGNVGSISSTGNSIQGTFKKKITYPPNSSHSQQASEFSTQIPAFANNAQLSQLLQKKHVTINAHPASSGPSFLAELLLGFGPTLLLILLFVFIMRRAAAAAGGGAGGLMSFGRSRARRVEGSDQPVTFADVAGIDEAKEDLTEIVDFLRNPDKYLRLGGKIPRGVLLSGA